MSHARSLIALTALSGASILACAAGVEPLTGPDGGTAPPPVMVEAGTTASTTDFQVRTDTRDAWLALAQWTHLYAISATGNAGDATEAEQRMVASGGDFATQAGALIGDDSSAALAKLLRARADIVVAFVDDAQNGEENEIAKAKEQWRSTTAGLASFFATLLGSANATSALETELVAFDAATQNEIVARTNGDFAAEVAASDQADANALAVGDTLSLGLIATFRSKLATSAVGAEDQTLRLELRPLLAQRAFWLRAFAIDQIAKKAAQPELDRAIAAHVAVAKVFTGFYGQAVGDQVELGFHNQTADGYAFLLATETGDTGAVDATSKLWAQDVATFSQYLVSTNPNWTLPEIQRVLGVDQDRTLAEFDARFAGQWDADAADYTMVVDNTGAFADLLATGLATAFPTAPH